MTYEQALLLGLLGLAVVGFLSGRWRHDMVALGTLLAAVAAGLVPSSDAFSGLGHPAVVTVACVLILSRALQDSGAVDLVGRKVLSADVAPLTTLAILTALVAGLSAFMNNVGALALLMPLAIKVAQRSGQPPGKF